MTDPKRHSARVSASTLLTNRFSRPPERILQIVHARTGAVGKCPG
jgi:hypothetical protein